MKYQHLWLIKKKFIWFMNLLIYFSSQYAWRAKKMTTIIDKSVSGSFLCITQFCNNCMHKRMWQSQPHIGNIPAGNILTSAAILYTGSLPAKALRIFTFLNCPTICCLATSSKHVTFKIQRKQGQGTGRWRRKSRQSRAQCKIWHLLTYRVILQPNNWFSTSTGKMNQFGHFNIIIISLFFRVMKSKDHITWKRRNTRVKKTRLGSWCSCHSQA